MKRRTYFAIVVFTILSTSSVFSWSFIGVVTSGQQQQQQQKRRVEKREEKNRRSDLTMRAWTCHGRSQKEMVDKLASANIVHSPAVREALLNVDRANYAAQAGSAYNDAPQPIGHGQTISAPHMHAHALEEMFPSLQKAYQNAATKSNHDKNDIKGDMIKILDVGVGSGYLTACLGRLLYPSNLLATSSSSTTTTPTNSQPSSPSISGRVYGIDVFPNLIDFAKSNIQKSDNDLLSSQTIQLSVGDGWQGLPSEGPYHAIHVGAAADTFPKNLMMQLKVGGVMICPIGPNGGLQNLYKIERLRDQSAHTDDGGFQETDFHIKALLGVRYVPLLHP